MCLLHAYMRVCERERVLPVCELVLVCVCVDSDSLVRRENKENFRKVRRKKAFTNVE